MNSSDRKMDEGVGLDALLDDVFLTPNKQAEDPGAEFKAKLLDSYDAHMRGRKNRLSLSLFADALGFRALARPLAAAASLGGICAAGFVAGVAAPFGDNSSYAELASAIDQTFAYAEEAETWAEE